MKGQSGNPKGRPKGSTNFTTMFNEIALEMITVTENGRPKTMPRIKAVLHRVMSMALSGELGAIKDVMRLFPVYEELASADVASSTPHEREAAVFKSFLKRLERMKDASESEIKKTARKTGDLK